MRKPLWAIVITALLICVLNLSFISAIDFPVSDDRSVTIKSGELDVAVNFHAAKDTTFSIAKNGGINLGDKASYYGTILLVPSYNDGSEWFLCPLTNIESGKEHIEGLSVSMDNPETRVTCYNRKDPLKTQDQRIMSLVSYTVTDGGKIKITADIRFLDFTPKDTGFGFYFISLDVRKYAMVKSTTESLAKSGEPSTTAVTVDMATVQKDLTVAKEVIFITDTGADVGQKFDWTDMIDFGYKFSEVITLGEKTGLLLGTYGYGESDTISIDPLYTVDYSPIPAQHLQQGNVTASSDGAFASITDITAGVSDNSTATQYPTNSYSLNPASFTYYDEAPTNDTSLVISIDGSFSDTQLDYNGGKYGRVLLGSGLFYNDSQVNLYFRPRDAVNISVIITNSANTVNYSTPFFTGVDTVNYKWENMTLFNLPANENSLYIHETNLADNRRIYIDYLQVLNPNYNNGSAISGKWSVTYDPSYQYFLRVYKTTSGSDTLFAYAYNSTNTISTQSTSAAISGTGWLNLNVTSLIQYMTTTLGLNYSAFRFYTNTSQNFSEERLRAETNDTTPPTVNSCTTNVTEIGCGGSALLRCNITDNLDVADAQFQVNATNHSTTKSGDLFSYTFSPVGATASTGLIYDWQYVYALDILSNSASYDPNIQMNYSCCTPNWTEQYSICQNNDSVFKTYTDTNSCGSVTGLPIDNGTSVYCNYCSEELEQVYITDCNLTGQRTYYWHDINYFSCCAITYILSDCSILYSPYNETGIQNCTIVINQFDVDYDANAFYGFTNNKIYWKINLNSTDNYTCLSYVKTETGALIQTNPVYTQRSDALLQLGAEYEDRQYFPTYNGIANVYFTKENIVVDGRDYIFGVECSSGATTLISERIITVGYKSLNEPVTRYFWLGENIVPIIIGILLLIALAMFIGFVIKRVKYG